RPAFPLLLHYRPMPQAVLFTAPRRELTRMVMAGAGRAMPLAWCATRHRTPIKVISTVVLLAWAAGTIAHWIMAAGVLRITRFAFRPVFARRIAALPKRPWPQT